MRIEGQIRGLQRMIEEDRDCPDILTQLLAVRASLDQVAAQVLNCQIENFVETSRGADPESRRALEEAIKMWAKLI
jgi:DNA-binding FrmR family transcriptional regulator